MTNKATPPREVLNELPDYFMGCLIFYDEYGTDNMRWIVYDGRRKVRCVSRSAAEKYAAEVSRLTSQDDINHLMIAHHHLKRAYQTLDKSAKNMDIETRLWIELKAVEIRKIADAVDLLIDQRIKRTNEI